MHSEGPMLPLVGAQEFIYIKCLTISVIFKVNMHELNTKQYGRV